MAVYVAAHRGEPGFGLKARRQFGQRRDGALMRAMGLGAVGIEAAVSFCQRRLSRGVAIDLALGIGMTFARGIGLALCCAPRIARGSFRGGSGLQLGLGGFQRLSLGAGIDTGLLKLVFDVDQSRALGETPRRTGRCVGGGDESIPAPDVAFRRHQPLAGLQLRHQLRAALLGDDADLREATRQLDGRIDMRRECLDAVGQGRIAFGDAGIGPAHRRRGIDRRIEIVAEGRAKRLLIALGDGDAVDDRRPQILGLAVDEFGDRARFGLKPLHALVGFVKRCAGGFQLLPRDDMGGFAALRRGLRMREIVLRGLHGSRECGEVAQAAGLLRQLLLVALDIGDVLIEPRQAIAMTAHAALKLIAPGGEVGEHGGQLGEQAFGGGQRRFSLGHAAIDAAPFFNARFDLVLQF